MPGNKARSKYKKTRKGFKGIAYYLKDNIGDIVDKVSDISVAGESIMAATNAVDTSTNKDDPIESVSKRKLSSFEKEKDTDTTSSILPLKRVRKSTSFYCESDPLLTFSSLSFPGLSTPSTSQTPLHGYKILHSNVLNSLLTFSKCCNCSNGTLKLAQNDRIRHGLCECLVLSCENCTFTKQLFTSELCKNSKHMFDVNLRSTLSTISAGGGQVALKKFCGAMDLPMPVHNNGYNRHLKKIASMTKQNCDSNMSSAAILLKQLNNKHPDDIVDVSVTVDGTWQKRYGHNSKHGINFVIAVDTGQVLDYEIKTLVCKECEVNGKLDHTSDKYKNWLLKHKCPINHSGSSESMEKDSAVLMFCRSLDKHKLRYTTFVGDGDTSAFAHVKNHLNEKYGDEYPIVKEDCIGHIQKRMGSSIRSYKNKRRGFKLSDGIAVGGSGRLTDAVADSMQNYYGSAIRNHVGDLDAMKNAIWAIFHHMIKGPPNESLHIQHQYCPTGKDSWCKYQKDISSGTSLYEDNCLPFIFRDELRPIFNRLSSDAVLGSCQRGLTQNQNESLNNTVWSRCPKRVYCGLNRLTISVCEAIITFNSGACAKSNIFFDLGLTTSANLNASFKCEDKKRIADASRKISEKYRLQRQKLRNLRKRRKPGKRSYFPGAFSTSTNPDIDISLTSKKKKSKASKKLTLKEKNLPEVNITFVDDSEVALIKPVDFDFKFI